MLRAHTEYPPPPSPTTTVRTLESPGTSSASDASQHLYFNSHRHGGSAELDRQLSHDTHSSANLTLDEGEEGVEDRIANAGRETDRLRKDTYATHASSVGTFPRLMGGSRKTLDGAYDGPPSRRNSTEALTAENEVDMDQTAGVQSNGAPFDPVGVKELRAQYWRSALVNVLLILSWYFFSTMISVYNKWMFSPKRYGFSYPLFVTSWHMVVQFCLASLALTLCDRRFGLELVPRRPNGGRARPSLRDWSLSVVPCAIATALDIGLSNLSLKTITLTFYTMCKSSNLAFVLFFAFIFRLEIVRLSLIGIIGLITVGVIMMVAAETKFVLVGAIEVLSASAMGGLRWALTQLLLDRQNMGLSNPVATVFWLAPVMFVAMFITSAVIESWRDIFASKFFADAGRTALTMLLVTAPGVLAFCMNLSEFALIRRTSVVTLSVAGIFKEVLTIILAGILFGDELSAINVTGLIITIIGIGLYNWLKYRTLTQAVPSTQSGGHRSGGYTHLSGGDFEAEQGTSIGNGGGRRVLFEADQHGHGAPPRKETQDEKIRRLKREEEADMDGWNSAGTTRTGNGYDEDSDYEG